MTRHDAVPSGVPPIRTWDKALGVVSDVVYQGDPEGRVLWVSSTVVDVLGHKPDDLVGTDIGERVHPEDHDSLEHARRVALQGDEPEPITARFATIDGTWRELALRTQPLLSAGRVTGEITTLRDEREVHAVRQAFLTVMAGNEVLVRARSVDELLQQTCEAVVAAGGYAFAWYGVPRDDAGRTVEPLAVGGEDHGYTRQVTVSWDADSPLGQGPTGISLRTGTTQVRNDFAIDPKYAPWLSAVAARGIRCSITMPVHVAGQVHGALMVYGRRPGEFGPVAQAMLEGLSAELGYGLERLADAERRLEAEQRFRLLAENATDVVISVDQDMVWQWVSPSSEAVLGWTPEELVGRKGADFLHPDDLVALTAAIESADAAAALTMRLRFLRPDGAYTWTSAAGRAILDDQGQPLGRVVSLRDITGEVRAEEALARSEALFRMIAEHALDVVVRTDGDGLIAWVSPSVRDALAWDPSELVGTALDDLMHAQDAESLQAADPDDGPDAREVRLRDRAGQWRWMRLHRTPVHEPGASGSGHIDSLRDIDREVRTRLQAAFDARHDALTGLLNRTGLFAMLDSSQSDGDPALVAVGIDNLRQINAAYTHTAGDRVLVRVAEILVEVLGRRDRVARSGDNEFSLLVPDADPTELTSLAVRLVEAGATTVGLGAQELPITISVGIALGSGRRAEELVRDASTALRQARAAGGHRWEFLDPGVEAEARRRLTIQSGLRTALTAGEIRPWFQPIVNLSDRTVIGYEALARWMRADGVVVPPDEFLPVAEQSDLIVLLDRHMLAEAMTAVGLLPSPLHVAANLSAASLADPGLLQHVEGSLAATGADPARVHLEVTETTLLHVTQDVLTVMSDVADLGITWWVDDFGTGYSSLAHLRDLPVRGLKLDRSFTDGVETPGSTHGRLAQGLAGLARGMGLRTVAEGVETQEQADALLALGWEVGQGWLYGRPGPLPAR